MHKYSDLITISTDILGGTPVFKRTRVPVATLFDYVETGKTVSDFIDDFPSVEKEQAIEILQLFKNKILNLVA